MTEPDDGKTRLTSSTAAEQQEKLITRSEQLTSETPQDASKLQVSIAFIYSNIGLNNWFKNELVKTSNRISTT